MNIFDPQSKILANADYVIPFLKTGYCPPILVEVDPSNVCNHACNFCLSSYVHPGRQMLDELTILRISRELTEVGTKAVNWTGGGEPTVNPYLSKAITWIGLHSDVKMGLFTNGTLLDKHGLLDAIVLYLSWVRISVDSGSPETYNRIRHASQWNDWNTMVANLKKLIARNSYSSSPIDIGVGFVVTPDNIDDVVPFARFFKDFDLTYCQFKPEIVNIEREHGKQRSGNFWNEAASRLQDAKSILGDKFQINGYKLEDLRIRPEDYGRSYRKCLGSQVSPCVGAEGRVYVCTNHRGHPQYSYGSIHEKSFPDIWRDMQTRAAIMHQIDNVEKFACCTKLCKPHESNKMLWELYQGYHSAADPSKFLSDLELRSSQVCVHHPEFI